MMAVAPKVNAPVIGATPKPLSELPKVGAAEAPAAPQDIDITLKNGQTANIGLEEVGKGGPADAAPGLKEIIPMLQELLKTLTGLLEKLGKLVPGAAPVPAAGGPAAPADGAAPANGAAPAAPVAAAAAQAGDPVVGPGAPGAPGKDGAPGRDGAPAPAPAKPKHHPGLFENIGRFLFGWDE